ncbi:MAG: hypothetical protein M1838_000231 [Thelocarpon superellum]|nr:MAG: hypothetical protein M1838_000231 [Thelocarpon superellum]
MSYYDNQSWPNAPRNQAWEQPPPPPRSGTSSAVQRDDSTAFSAQFEEVDRAVDNLVKSGKMFGAPGRRDSMPGVPGGPRAFQEFDARSGGAMPPRPHAMANEYDQIRSHSASNLQNYYANQRYQPRPNEAEQMMQAKRRMAAQRERELRNYHQEQQYNRTVLADGTPQGNPDRAMSPSTMKEGDRRDLIARQHRALYGSDAPAFPENGGQFGENGPTPRPGTQASGPPPSSSSAGRGPSPLAFDPFGLAQTQGANQAPGPNQTGESNNTSTEHAAPAASASASGPSPVQPQQRSRANSTSPSSNPANFSLFDSAAQQSSRTSASSPGGSPPRQAPKSSTAPIGSGVAPIGTRPATTTQGQASNPAHNKRSTTPLPSPLGYGFAPKEEGAADEQSTPVSTNPPSSSAEHGVGLGWGSKGGVWGNKGSLGVQASVWG